VLQEPLRSSGPDGRQLGKVAPTAGNLVRAVGARDDDPVVGRGVDLLVGRALDLDQRTLDDLVSAGLEPSDERAGLIARPRHDHSHEPTPRSRADKLPPTHPGEGTRSPPA
jgi:hypothetical protein